MEELFDYIKIAKEKVNKDKENNGASLHNFYTEFIKEYKEIRKKEGKKPRLLLHVCCAPCSAYPLMFLKDLFDISIYYTNSNIFPYIEYDKRLYHLKKFINDLNTDFNIHIELIEDRYDYESFKEDLIPYKFNKEMGERCRICVAKRIDKLFSYAKTHGFKYVSSVMSISRNKDAYYLNKLGETLETKYKDSNIRWIYSDFKKNEGQEIGVKIANKYNLYRQDYCGCEFSIPKKKKDNEIAIIVAIHGVYKYLDRCLESLKNQDITVSYEVVCVLDNPLYEDKEIAYKYKNLAPNLFSVYEVNFKEVSEVRNFGIMHSYSRFICFIDGDDFVESNYLSVLYNTITKNDCDLVQCNFYLTYGNKNKKNLFENPPLKKKMNNIKACKTLCYDFFIRGFSWNKIFKRDIIENNSIFFLSFKYCIEDIFFVFIYLLNSKKVIFVKNYLNHYVQRIDSQIHESPIKSAQKIINSQFLINYYAIRKEKKEATKINYFFKKISLYLNGISGRKYLETTLFSYFKLVNKQIKKIAKNKYRFEGEEWEKALYLYIEKQNSNYYINKGSDL